MTALQTPSASVIKLRKAVLILVLLLRPLPLLLSFTGLFSKDHYMAPKEEPLGIAGESFFTGWMPFLSPNQQYQSTEKMKNCCNGSSVKI